MFCRWIVLVKVVSDTMHYETVYCTGACCGKVQVITP